MTYEVLQILWYLVFCAAVVFYTILDGFDLGVGSLHLCVKSDNDRRIFLNAIGPVWDGNEVWLIIIGGALFAGFPPVYATVFSAFYTLFMIFLAGIIFRAVAIEFRSKHESKSWRQFWDIIFFLGSFIMSFGSGVLLGNVIMGMPIGPDQVHTSSFWSLFRPYPILVGLLSLSVFTLHGHIFLLMKTEGSLHDRLRKWMKPLMAFFLVMFVIVSLDTMRASPHMHDRFGSMPWLYLIPALLIGCISSIPYLVGKKYDGFAFISSSMMIILLYTLFGIGTFPILVRSTIDPAYNMTLFNSSSAESTLKIILTIACIGVPLVISYGWMIYSIFRGKVKLDKMSY